MTVQIERSYVRNLALISLRKHLKTEKVTMDATMQPMYKNSSKQINRKKERKKEMEEVSTAPFLCPLERSRKRNSAVTQAKRNFYLQSVIYTAPDSVTNVSDLTPG